MNQVKAYAKTIAAFVAAVVGNMIVNLVNGVAPWPQNTAQWVQFAVTSFGAALAVLIAPNTITQKQIDKDPTVVRVNPQSATPAAGEYPNPWK